MRHPARALFTALVAVGLLTSACGDDGPARSSTTTSPTPTSTASVSTTTAPATSSTTVNPGKVVEATFSGGKVQGPSQADVRLGEEVTIRVTSDVADEVHVHTYDLHLDLEPGVPGEVTFRAGIPGRHEVELEGQHRRLLILVVS